VAESGAGREAVTRLPRAVAEALERWERDRLLSVEQVAALRAEAAEHAGRSGRRGFQYVLAATGGVVALITAGVLADWIWPQLGDAGRSLVLIAVGFAVHFLGQQVETRERWQPAGYLLQTSGLLVVLGAFMYSERPWPDVSAPAIAIGVVGLLLPLVLAYRAVGRDPFMPAVHVALGFAFLAVFLDRATPLDDDAIVWTLDAVLLVVVAGLVLRLRRSTGVPEEAWALNAFVAALYAGLVLILFTGLGPLDLSEDTVWAMDLWLTVVTALTLWGIHGAPPALQRSWFGEQLALCVGFAIPLAFYSVLEALDLEATGVEPEAAALAVGAVGGLAVAHGLRHEQRSVLAAGCIALVAAAWYYGIDRGGVLGAVLALAATAALLFWLSARLGRRE
jgi:hypothetical protein